MVEAGRKRGECWGVLGVAGDWPRQREINAGAPTDMVTGERMTARYHISYMMHDGRAIELEQWSFNRQPKTRRSDRRPLAVHFPDVSWTPDLSKFLSLETHGYDRITGKRITKRLVSSGISHGGTANVMSNKGL